MPTEDLVWVGYQLLNEAVLFGSGAWGSSLEQRSRQRRHLPRPLNIWMPALVDGRYITSARLKLHGPALHTQVASGDRFPREEWLTRIRRQCRSHELPSEIVESALRHPASTLRLSYRLARLSAARLGMKSPEFGLALAVFRSAATPLISRRQCQVCFRVAFPGTVRCRVHSRSKLVALPDANQSSRAARMALEQLPGFIKRSKLAFRAVHRPALLAGVLFPKTIRDSGDWRDNVVDALAEAPHVVKLLGQSHLSWSPARLLAGLRGAIDPDEWRVDCWLEKIGLAEEWLGAVSRIAPGGPPKGPRSSTLELLMQIEDLLVNESSVKTIALTVGVSTANVYQMLHRHGIGGSVRTYRSSNRPLRKGKE